MRSFLLFIILAMVATSSLVGQIFFTAKLQGSQEVPAVTTTASGTGTFLLTSNGTQLVYNITVNGLTPTAAHFHNADQGIVGNIVRDLSLTNNTTSGTWSSTETTQALSDSMLSELLRGRLYVNVHTSANPGGEIRGQVLLSGPATFTAKMEGSQETPPVTTNAAGTGSVRLNTDGTVTHDATVTGLSGAISASHYHNGPVGVLSPVVRSISFTNNTSTGTWTSTDASQRLTDLLLRELIKGRLYLNAHTSLNPNGEIRGQILLKSGIVFTANLQGSQGVPAVTTTASGTGTFVLGANGTQLAYNITINGLTPTAAHFHNGAMGIASNVVRDLSFTNNTAFGVWSSTETTQAFSDSMLSELLRGRLYVNVHTAANPDGEIRGQVLLTSVAGFTSKMEGSQETPPVTTNAAGTGSVRLNTDGTVTHDATVTGLSGAISASHYHNGPVGVLSPVVRSISFTNNTSTGTWTSTDASQRLTDLLLRELIKGRLYLNAHTSLNPNGEIRGQLLSSTGVATSVERTENGSIPEHFALDQNYPNPFNPSTTIRFELARSAKVVLKLYNVLGQEVATLVDGVKPAGTQTVKFDGAGLNSGMYFYRVTTDDGFVAIKKMVLIK